MAPSPALSPDICELMDDQWLGNQIFHAHPGIERAERILKNDLHVAAQTSQLAV